MADNFDVGFLKPGGEGGKTFGDFPWHKEEF